nr:RNA-directed DNA polymerase, eukaryota, reverse transcriptase zinc-binding domain protein [Tanacetum cinerariifolium]
MGGNNHHNSYVFAVKQGSKQQGVEEMNKPSLVLDDSCILHRVFSSSLMGKVKDFGSLPNLKLFPAKEGFDNISIKYMRGFWVLIEFQSKVVLEKFKANVEGDSDAEEIPKTIFDKEDVESKKKEGMEDFHYDDPFKLYDLLNKKKVISNEAEHSDEHSDGNLKYPQGFTPRDATKVNSNSVDKDSGEEKECDQNCYENKEVSVTKKKRSSSIPEEDRDVMGYKMEGCVKNIEEAKKEWVKELCISNKVNFLSLQETKMENVDCFNIKNCWGNFAFDFVRGPSVGNSGGIICVWDSRMFRKRNHTIFDYFVTVKNFLNYVIDNWNGEVVIMDDFNEVRSKEERYCSCFNVQDKRETDSNPLAKRIDVMKSLQDMEKIDSLEVARKAKIKWSIKGDENSKFFHGILNKKRSQLAIHGILVDGSWIDSPSMVKNGFLFHFKDRFDQPCSPQLLLDINFPVQLSVDQQTDLEISVSNEEIKRAVWDCGLDKSLGPYGFTFGFYRRNDSRSLWARVIKVIHGEEGNLGRLKGDMAFKYRFPIVYALESNKNVTVAEKLAFENLGHSLRRIPRDGAEISQFIRVGGYFEWLSASCDAR